MFKYLGDDFLTLSDSLYKLSKPEQIIMNMNNNGIFFEDKEFIYVIEADKELRRQAEFMMGINRVLKSDPKKYKRILAGQDPEYPAPRKIQIVLADKNLNQMQPNSSQTKKPQYLQ